MPTDKPDTSTEAVEWMCKELGEGSHVDCREGNLRAACEAMLDEVTLTNERPDPYCDVDVSHIHAIREALGDDD